MTAQRMIRTDAPAQGDTAGAEGLEICLTRIEDRIGTLSGFLERRFAELSAEIDATSQQVDMAEEGLARRFSDILGVLWSISFRGNGLTPANTGVELDAVVKVTEDAAVRIMDAANRISEGMADNAVWKDAEAKDRVTELVHREVEEIFLACSFQDITGQRIRKTLEHLRTVEESLNAALASVGIEVPSQNGAEPSLEAAQTQDDIDAMFD